MGCYSCGGNPNTWCTKCMPAEDTWVAPVDKLPDVFMGDRDHMYLLPNGDLFILSPDRTKWIKVNGTGNTTAYDDTEIKKRITDLENRPDKDTITTVTQGKRIRVTKNGNDYTVSGTPLRAINIAEGGKEPLVSLGINNDGDTFTLNTLKLAEELGKLQKKEDRPVTPSGVTTFFAKGDISGNGNSQGVKVTKDKLVNADTIKVGDIVTDSYWNKDFFNIGMFKVASVDGNTVTLNGINDITYRHPKQGLTLSGRVLSISDGNSVTLPNDKQTISRQGNKLVLSNGGGEVDLPTPKDVVPYDDTALKKRVEALEKKEDKDNQTLSLNGRVLSISNGNSVTLPEDLNGGDNLICNSGSPTTTNGWGYWEPGQNNSNLSLRKHSFYYNNTTNMFVLSNNTSSEVPASSVRFKVKRNTTYSVNLSTFATSNLKSMRVLFLGRQNGQTDAFTKGILIKEVTGSPSTTGVVNLHATFNTGDNDEGYIRIDNKGTSNGSESLLFFGDVDVYEGTSNRAYRPSLKCALDSISNKPDNDRQTLSLTNNTLSISNGNSVNLPQYVSPQEFNNLKNEYNQLKGAFTALLQNLKNTGAWNQTGGTIFEGSLKPDRNIATGNINLFGGTVDGNAFIRTNNGKTENDLAGGIS